MTFEELGKYLDSLDIPKRLDQVGRILEDTAFPKVTVNAPPPDDLQWSKCSPRADYPYIQLTRQNCASVRTWMLGEAGFDRVDREQKGLHTEYGDVKWGEYIVQEPDGATSFYSQQEFEKFYHRQ